MDGINAGIIAGSVIGVGTAYNGNDSKAKKKSDDNKKVEKKESGLL